MNCRVCASPLTAPALSLPAPGLSSLTTTIDAPTITYVCNLCSHAQSPTPTELEAFYDNEYRISLQSDDFDQLHSVENGEPVFRTARQLEVLLGLVTIRDGMKVLDYGAAKAQSLKALLDSRPNIVPYVFDVSEDYRKYWNDILPKDQTATYELPTAWQGSFDLVTAYFVIEHVEDPTAHLKELRKFLSEDGRIFIIVPDSLNNSGDLLIVDHVNKFSRTSLHKACELSGLEVEGFDETGFTGSIALVARKSDSPSAPTDTQVRRDAEAFEKACSVWRSMKHHIIQAVDRHQGKPLAMHGAGFYGSFIMQQLGAQAPIAVVLDNNPHLQGGEFFGRPVVAVDSLPAHINSVIVALNPSIAHTVVGDGKLYGREDIRLTFLE